MLRATPDIEYMKVGIVFAWLQIKPKYVKSHTRNII